MSKSQTYRNHLIEATHTHSYEGTGFDTKYKPTPERAEYRVSHTDKDGKLNLHSSTFSSPEHAKKYIDKLHEKKGSNLHKAEVEAISQLCKGTHSMDGESYDTKHDGDFFHHSDSKYRNHKISVHEEALGEHGGEPNFIAHVSHPKLGHTHTTDGHKTASAAHNAARKHIWSLTQPIKKSEDLFKAEKEAIASLCKSENTWTKYGSLKDNDMHWVHPEHGIIRRHDKDNFSATQHPQYGNQYSEHTSLDEAKRVLKHTHNNRKYKGSK